MNMQDAAFDLMVKQARQRKMEYRARLMAGPPLPAGMPNWLTGELADGKGGWR